MSSDKWPLADRDSDPLPRRSLRLTAIFLGVVLGGVLVAWLLNTDDPSIASVGSKAPAFDVKNIVRGESITLDDLLSDGRPIVINLMASWCGPCRAEIPELSKFADSHPGVIVIGVAVEDAYDDFKEFVTELRPTYPVAFDEGEMRASYQSLGLPTTFFVNSDGSINDVLNGILNQDVLEERASDLS